MSTDATDRAALKRFADQGRQTTDRPLLEWTIRDALHQSEQRLLEVFDNLPGHLTGRVLKWILLPYGSVYPSPSDSLLQRCARVILRYGSARDRLTDGIFVPRDESDSLTQLELALVNSTGAESIIADLRKGMLNGQLRAGDPEHYLLEAVSAGIIDEREAAQVRAAIAARQKVIGVDEFPADYWKEKRDSWQKDPTRSHQAGQSI